MYWVCPFLRSLRIAVSVFGDAIEQSICKRGFYKKTYIAYVRRFQIMYGVVTVS